MGKIQNLLSHISIFDKVSLYKDPQSHSILVMQCLRVVYREYPTSDLIFLSIHTSLKARVYTKKNQVTSGIFTVYHGKAN